MVSKNVAAWQNRWESSRCFRKSTNLETVLTASCKAMQIPMIKSDIGFYPNILFWCMSKEWLKDRGMNRVMAKDQIGQIELKNGEAKAFCGGRKALEIYSCRKWQKCQKCQKKRPEINLFTHLLMSKVIFQLSPAGSRNATIAEDDVSTSKEWTFSTFYCRKPSRSFQKPVSATLKRRTKCALTNSYALP